MKDQLHDIVPGVDLRLDGGKIGGNLAPEHHHVLQGGAAVSHRQELHGTTKSRQGQEEKSVAFFFLW